jgi:hypothetical protein
MELDAESPPRARWKQLTSTFLVGSVLVHLFFIGGAAYFVVSRYSPARKLTFAAGPRSPNPSEQALQHRVQVEKKMQSQSMPAAVPKRVLTTGLAKVALPPLPDLPAPKGAADAPTMAGSGQIGSFGASGAPGSGAPGGTGSGSPINFFGIRDTSSSVVIMIDVSDSMFTRTGDAEASKLVKTGAAQSFQTIRDEASKLVQSLGPNVRFGIIRWAGSANSWKPELVSATEENKRAAIAHIQNEVDMKSAKPQKGKPGGTRHDYALEAAFRLKPELIYMLTDGNATAAQKGGGLAPIPEQEIYNTAEDGQKTLTKRARLHAIYYVTGEEKQEERQMLSRLAARNDGKFLRVEAKGRKR